MSGLDETCRGTRPRRRLTVLALTTTGLLSGSALLYAQAPATRHGDAERGRRVYQVCAGCHSLDEDDVGPRHRGVVGRQAGSVPGYAYSPALRDSHLQWSPENLDRWLQNPQALVPGAKMFFALADATDRADVIAYLEQQR
ncbi:MAG: c-type cytochrome [Proteobacteria bacterium]|nr:c-type cytochrome [Pseudomonadota bacterium]